MTCPYFIYKDVYSKVNTADVVVVSSFLSNSQSVTCLATDPSLTADQGVASSIPAWSHTFQEIDHEIISKVILLLPLNHSRRVVVIYKRKFVH